MAFSQCHICQCLTNISALRRTSPVTISGHRRETGEQFTQSVYSLALGLRELGVQRGDVIAIAALNSDWYLEWLLAVAYVGCIAAPLNLRWSFEEARSAMEQVGPIILVVDESCKTWLSSIQLSPVPTLKIAIFLSDLSSSSLINIKVLSQDAMRKPLVGPPSFDYQSAPEGIALICFTSGTTGRPKGVAISHMALIVQSLAKIAIVGYGEDDVYLHTAPLCHIGGISSAVAMLMVAGCHVFIPKFDAKAALLAIKEHNVTSFITVPTMVADINSFLSGHGAWGGGTSVKKILNGGGGLSNELMKAAARIFPNATLLSAYGMTEASSSLTFMTLNVEVGSNSHHHKLGGVCVGKPAPHVELLIAGGTDSKINGHHVGRVLTRGPHLMVKYWGDQATTTSPGSWLDTGDEGYMDESGNLWLMGRVNDRIKSGGENVYPQEVEAILSEHPGITDVLVVGLPHPRLTEMVAACVRIQENWRWEGQNSYHFDFSEDQLLSQEMLQNYCRQRILTGFKIPKMFILWHKPFPVTTTGKPRRDEIRREVISHLQLLPSNL